MRGSGLGASGAFATGAGAGAATGAGGAWGAGLGAAGCGAGLGAGSSPQAASESAEMKIRTGWRGIQASFENVPNHTAATPRLFDSALSGTLDDSDPVLDRLHAVDTRSQLRRPNALGVVHRRAPERHGSIRRGHIDAGGMDFRLDL